MKVLIDIPKSTYKDIKESYSITCGENFAQKLVKYIKNGVPFQKGATNGDVIKAMFPNVSNSNMDLVDALKNAKSWWNAPYRS